MKWLVKVEMVGSPKKNLVLLAIAGQNRRSGKANQLLLSRREFEICRDAISKLLPLVFPRVPTAALVIDVLLSG